MSRYKTVTDSVGWSGGSEFEAFSVANGRISYIVGDKPYFLGKCKICVDLAGVYIAESLW